MWATPAEAKAFEYSYMAAATEGQPDPLNLPLVYREGTGVSNRATIEEVAGITGENHEGGELVFDVPLFDDEDEDEGKDEFPLIPVPDHLLATATDSSSSSTSSSAPVHPPSSSSNTEGEEEKEKEEEEEEAPKAEIACPGVEIPGLYYRLYKAESTAYPWDFGVFAGEPIRAGTSIGLYREDVFGMFKDPLLGETIRAFMRQRGDCEETLGDMLVNGLKQYGANASSMLNVRVISAVHEKGALHYQALRDIEAGEELFLARGVFWAFGDVRKSAIALYRGVACTGDRVKPLLVRRLRGWGRCAEGLCRHIHRWLPGLEVDRETLEGIREGYKRNCSDVKRLMEEIEAEGGSMARRSKGAHNKNKTKR